MVKRRSERLMSSFGLRRDVTMRVSRHERCSGYNHAGEKTSQLAQFQSVLASQFPLRLLFLGPLSRYSCLRNLLLACIRMDLCHEILPLSQTVA